MKKLILVTGADGFIGQHLTATLLRSGYDVQLIDDIFQPVKPRGKLHAVIHLAGVSLARHFKEDPHTSFNVNLMGTLTFLELARQSGAHFVFASSSAVYGNPRSLRVSEAHPLRPINAYAKSKVMGEILCEEYAKLMSAPVTVLLFFNVFGQGQRSEFIIPSIVKSITDNSPVNLRNPNSKRDFLYIDDLNEAIKRVIKSKLKGFHVFNVGNGQSHAVKEIVKEMMLLTRKNISWKKISGPKMAEVRAINADIKAIKREVGWTPKISLREGLKRILDHHK